ncbi:MAG: HYR domain-containing protein [Owenweeksia sp.]|nr:HYR domain-containing protein [Owenweeksia sp.]
MEEQAFSKASENLGFNFWQTIGDPAILPFDPYAEGIYDLAVRIENKDGVELMQVPIRVEVGCEFVNPAENLEPPVLVCPADTTINAHTAPDPSYTGWAHLDGNCDGEVTYSDDRSGLDQCNQSGSIIRTWSYDNGLSVATCSQTITIIDTTAPALAACLNDITMGASAGNCDTAVTFESPMAFDKAYYEGFENPNFEADSNGNFLGWNYYNSPVMRVASGTDGVTSSKGAAHGVIDTNGTGSFNGAFNRLGGYRVDFGNGFTTSLDIYIDLNDPAVLSDDYGWDLTTAANGQDSTHQRDFIFHAASNASGNVLIGPAIIPTYPRNDLASLSNYEITSTGWYQFKWVFRDSAGVLAVDLELYDASGNFLWKETRYNAADLIASIVGGNRYMWFTFLEAERLHIDNTRLLRKSDVTASHSSGDLFAVGTTTVSFTATDACGQEDSCTFNINIEDDEAPVAVCKDTILYLDANGQASLNGEDLDGGSFDNCTADLAFALSKTGFSCADIGTQQLVLTVTDSTGNTDTCHASVSVVDTIPPAVSDPKISYSPLMPAETAVLLLTISKTALLMPVVLISSWYNPAALAVPMSALIPYGSL